MRLNGILSAVVATVVCASAHGAVSYASVGSTYLENFDRPAGPIGNDPWTNDSTIPGWSAFASGGVTVSAGPPATVRRGTGGNSPDSLYLWRANNDATDHALGSLNYNNNSASGTGYIAYGVALLNNTGKTLTQATVRYAVELWSINQSTSGQGIDSVAVSWAINPAGVTDADGTWTTVTGMGFSYSAANPPVLTPPSVEAITGLNWLPGDTLVLRFRDGNIPANDRGMAIDDFSFRAIPEPASLSLVAGLLSLASLRRR